MWLQLEEYRQRHELVNQVPDQVLRYGYVATEWAIPDLDIDDMGWSVGSAKQELMEY